MALQKLKDGKPTRDWQEQAFSEAHGWPACVAVHQERLVIGGSRDVPDRLWFSKTGHPFNFDPGTGLDDEAISFRLAGDEQHASAACCPGGCCRCSRPAASGSCAARRSRPRPSRSSCRRASAPGPARRLDPVEVDGAALFVGASGRELREFLYAESEQAYQAADIALLSRHLLVEPGAMRFDRRRRWLLIVRADGRLAAVAIDRNSNVVAWSLLESAGAFRSVAIHDGEPHFLVELGGQMLLERFDEALMTDHAVTLTSPTPTASWSGLQPSRGARGRRRGRRPAGAPHGRGAGAVSLPRAGDSWSPWACPTRTRSSR